MASANFSGDSRYRIDYTVSVVQQDVANNRTQIRRVLNMVKQSGSGDWSGSPVSYYSSTGPTNIGTNYFSFDFTGYSTLTLINTTQWVTHNADGTKSFTATAFVAADLSTGSPSNRQASVSFNVTLPTIPRATTPTMSGGFTTGVTSTINLPRASSAFTHDVSWSIGTKSGSLGTGLATSATWNPPHSVLTELPNTSSGNVTITVDTKNGATVIGTRTAQFTLTAAASVVPTVSGVSWSDTNTTVATNIGAFVQGQSLMKGAVTASGVHGSTITSKSVLVGGQTLPENTVFTVSGSGTVTAQGKAIDSRGRSNTVNANFSVLAYSEPTIGANGWQVRRANASNVATNDGTYLRLDLHAIATGLTVGGVQKNSLTISVRTRPTNGSWTNRNTVNPGLTQNGAIQISGGAAYLTTQSYEVEITITDKATSTPMVLKTTISTAIVTIDLNGNSVGIGKYHENGVLDVAGDIYMSGTKVSVEGHTHNASAINAGTLAAARLPAATETAIGAVERATQAEVNAGTDTTRYVTPLTLKASPGVKERLKLTTSNIYLSGGGSAEITHDGEMLNLTSATNTIGLKGIFEPGYDYHIEAVINAYAPSSGFLWGRYIRDGVPTTANIYNSRGFISYGTTGLISNNTTAASSIKIGDGGATAQSAWYIMDIIIRRPALGGERSIFISDAWNNSTSTYSRCFTPVGGAAVPSDGFAFLAHSAGTNINAGRIFVSRTLSTWNYSG